MVAEWLKNEQGNWWYMASKGGEAQIRWHVSKRNDGWWWYVVSFGGKMLNASREIGPFATWELAASDCVNKKGVISGRTHS